MKNHMKMSGSGFTLVETIVSLIVVSVSLLLLTMCLSLMKNSNKKMFNGEDEIAVRQIRLLYALSEKIVVNDKMMEFEYYGEEMHFVFTKNNLILKNGYQVFLKELSNVMFYKEDSCVYIQFSHIDQKKQDRIIGC